MKPYRFAMSIPLFCLPLSVFGQAKPDVSYLNDSDPHQRSFALVVESSVVTMNGGWHPIAQLARYAGSHAGTYIVFTQDGQLRRLENPQRLAEAQQLYEPMRALAAKQQALAAEQKPFAEQQRALDSQQRAATDPHEMTRIGAEQAAVGREQGEIGQLQGAVGRQQGEIGRAFYNRVQVFLDACLADGSCPRVAREIAQR